MRKKLVAVIVMIILVAGGTVWYKTSRSPAPQISSQPQTYSVNSLVPNTQIYDVRTREEYNAGHVEGAVLFPVTDIQAGSYPPIAKNTPIALYCRSGHRAGIALEVLKAAGYTNVKSIGGLDDLGDYGLAATVH